MTKRKKLEWGSQLKLERIDWPESPFARGEVSQILRDARPPQVDLRLVDFFAAANVERRRGMSDADCWLNILEELKEKAETYNAVYQHELRKPRPRISVLIRVWCQHFEGMEVAFWATPSGPQQDAFKAEMRFADEMINKLAAPYLKAFGLEELSDG